MGRAGAGRLQSMRMGVSGGRHECLGHSLF